MRPSWRDDDAGTSSGTSPSETQEVNQFVDEQLLRLCERNAHRIATAMQRRAFDLRSKHVSVTALLRPFQTADASDDDRDILRTALRSIINGHRNHNRSLETNGDAWLCDLEADYVALAPSDLLRLHRWLFETSWLQLPEKHLLSYEDFRTLTDERRNAALKEIYTALGLEGITQLIDQSAESWTIGWGLAQFSEKEISWPEWLLPLAKAPETHGRRRNAVRGFLAACPTERSTAILKAMLAIDESATAEDKGRLLTLARAEHALWALADQLEPAVQKAYWSALPVGSFRVEADEMNSVVRQLLAVGRPSSALVVSEFGPEHVEPELLLNALQRFVAGEELHGPTADPWDIAKALEVLEGSANIDRMQLVQLEFGLFPALKFENEQAPLSLYNAITSDPALFVELLCVLFKPRHGERTEPVTESQQAAAFTAWDVLHACRRLPGTRDDGTIDAADMMQFVDELMARCRDVDRREVGAEMLGQILAHAPSDDDGSWPCFAVREVLERPELEDMRRGFRTGIFNNRGTTWRSPTDGGEQERALSRSFAGKAAKIQHTHPLVAAVLEDLAADYLRDAHNEDIDARLNEEGF